MIVHLWQVEQQAHHPLVFYLRTWEIHQATIHTMETIASAARQLPLEMHSQDNILFPLIYHLIDLGLFHPFNFIFWVEKIWLSGFLNTEKRPQVMWETQDATHMNLVLPWNERGTSFIMTPDPTASSETGQNQRLFGCQGAQRSLSNPLVLQGTKPGHKRM